MKNGYQTELSVHKETIEQAMAGVPDEDDMPKTKLEDLQDSLDALTQAIANYSVAAGGIQKLIAAWCD